MPLSPSEWAAIWYRCLICHRCFQFPDKLISHRKNTSCGIKYLDLHLDDLTSLSLSEKEGEQERQESSSVSDSSSPEGEQLESEDASSTKITPSPNFEDVVDDNIKLSQIVSNCDLQGQLIEKQNVCKTNQSTQTSCAVTEEENVTLKSNTNTPSLASSFSTSSPLSREGQFFCKFCYLKLDSLKDLQYHIRHHRQDEKIYKCYFCSSTFKKPDHIESHLRFHTQEKPYNCTFCKMEFTQKHCINSHQKNCITWTQIGILTKSRGISVKVENTRTCKTANEFLKNQSKGFSCKICARNYTVKDSLSSHMHLHSKTNPYKCQNCGKMLRNNGELKRHFHNNLCRRRANALAILRQYPIRV